MKTTNKKTSVLVRSTLSLALVSFLILSMAFSQQAPNKNLLLIDEPAKLSLNISSAKYIASEFNTIKRENHVSDKVLLKIFVKYMKVRKYK